MGPHLPSNKHEVSLLLCAGEQPRQARPSGSPGSWGRAPSCAFQGSGTRALVSSKDSIKGDCNNSN